MTDTPDYRANWAAYLKRMMDGRSQSEFARTLGVGDGQLSKWLSGRAGVTPETVIDIARRLGDNPLHALGRVGWLTPADLEAVLVPRQFSIDSFTDRELAMEIVRRIDNGEATSWLSEPPVPDDEPDVGGLSEDELRRNFATAAGTDNSQPNEDESTP